MLWLIKGESSHAIISCNMHEKEDGKLHQVWVERPNGKTMLIIESADKSEAEVIKNAVDYAIEHGHKTLNLTK